MSVCVDDVDALSCSYCDSPASTVHLLPYDGVTPQAVRFACVDHDPGGYWFYGDRWFTGPPHLHKPGERFTFRDRLLTKGHGADAVAMIEDAISADAGVGEWNGPSVVSSLPWFDAADTIECCRECGVWASRVYHEFEAALCHECEFSCDRCKAPAVSALLVKVKVPGAASEFLSNRIESREFVCAACKPEAEREAQRTDRRVVLTPASAIRSERVRWLGESRIPLRGLTAVAGEKGLGKSIYTNAQLVAAVTRGTLDGELCGRPADAFVLTAEDDWRAVVKPRLIAYNADLDRVHRVEVRDKDGVSLLTLPDDVRSLESAITRRRAAGHTVALVVVDPVGAFVSESTNSHAEAPVRRVLAPLAMLADRLDLAVVAVMHLNKDEAKRLISRVTGAAAWVNAARSVLAVVRDPDDPEGEQGNRRLILHAASNWGRYAPTLAVHVESRLVDTDDRDRADVGFMIIDGESATTVDDVQRGPDDHADDAEQAVGLELANGPRQSLDVKSAVAKRLGCSHKTVQRAAMRMRDRGELAVEESGFPRTTTWAFVKPGHAQSGQDLSPQRVPTEKRGSTEPNSGGSRPQSGQSGHGSGLGPTTADDGPTDLTEADNDEPKGGIA